MLDARIHDVLTLAFFLLRRHLVDYLLVLLGLLLGEERLLSCKLILGRVLLHLVVATALKGREEVIEKDALAWLHLSALALGSFLLAVS